MITINYQLKTPLYEQIADQFQLMILKGVLQPDEQMPSVRSLASKLSINPNTIQKAYTQLEQQGYIYPIKGRGNFVCNTEHISREEKDRFFHELGTLLRYGHDLGIKKEELSAFMENFYNNGGNI